jgi:hypothetical protein
LCRTPSDSTDGDRAEIGRELDGIESSFLTTGGREKM